MNIVQLLISKGPNLNYNLPNGQSPLSIAVKKDNLEIVKLLVENGAEMNTHDGNGLTPFHIAIVKKHMTIVKFFKENGANLVIRTVNFKNNAVELAMKPDHLDILKQLVYPEELKD